MAITEIKIDNDLLNTEYIDKLSFDETEVMLVPSVGYFCKRMKHRV